MGTAAVDARPAEGKSSATVADSKENSRRTRGGASDQVRLLRSVRVSQQCEAGGRAGVDGRCERAKSKDRALLSSTADTRAHKRLGRVPGDVALRIARQRDLD